MNCRHCQRALGQPFLDLGFAPPSNAYLSAVQLRSPELHFPLKLRVCESCWLAQTEDYARAEELFSSEYAYFSSISQTWLEHAARYSREVTARFGLGSDSFVVELASNDGYLLRNFVAAQIPCLGVEPTASTADAAAALGIPVLREFFGESVGARLASEGHSADLVVGNNVFAHVPDINDFSAGIFALLKPDGVVTLEFPHLERLLADTQFDTVYHEHFSYLSLHAVEHVFEAAGLRIFDVQRLPTHGGSLRVFGCRQEGRHQRCSSVNDVLTGERASGLTKVATYAALQARTDRIKDDLLTFLIEQKRAGKRVAAYGAAAKGNTLLNYAGVKSDLLAFVCDAAPSKQGKFLPGSHLAVVPPAQLKEYKPDFVVILPWNIQREVMEQQSIVRTWGGRFVVAVPELTVLP